MKKENNGIITARVVKEVYSKTCPECDETFTSENKNQLKWNFDVHHNACKRRAELKKQKEKKK